MTEIWFIEVGKSKACHNFMGRQTLPSIFESHLPGNTPERIPHSGLSCPRCLLGKEEERKRLYSAGTIHGCSINPLNPGTLLTHTRDGKRKSTKPKFSMLFQSNFAQVNNLWNSSIMKCPKCRKIKYKENWKQKTLILKFNLKIFHLGTGEMVQWIRTCTVLAQEFWTSNVHIKSWVWPHKHL